MERTTFQQRIEGLRAERRSMLWMLAVIPIAVGSSALVILLSDLLSN